MKQVTRSGLSAGLFAAVSLLTGCGGGDAASDNASNPNASAGTSAGQGGDGNGSGGSSGTVGSAGIGNGGVVNAGYDVGFSPMTRLNRVQYNNTVADLLGTSLAPAARIPADNLALGFDTIAGVLNVSPEHAEGYLAAARELTAEFMARPATAPARARYITCELSSGALCHLEVLRNFAQAAWRRPVADTELTAYSALVAAQPTADEGIALGLRAILTSANFIYRIERDANPDDPTAHGLSAHELASRLSYFLWSTTPDGELRAAADSGALLDPATLAAQVERLLTDPARARQIIDNFGSQWLNINRVNSITPDPVMFPEFDAPLRQAMAEESKLFFGEMLTNGQPVSQMFTADFKFVNERLALHYDLPGVTGEAMQRVSTAGSNRLGILTQGAFLAGTSNPTRTSPVKRGLMVMERLLCAPPPPPPPGVDVNIDEGSGLENLSVRERLAEHLAKGETCASCHRVIDQIGLGLENYDAVGKYRTADEWGDIDATGALPDAEGNPVAFNGASEMAAVLATDARIAGCVTKELLTYALGRQIRGSDAPMKEAITAVMEQNGSSLRSAIEAVINSDAFKSRRAATAAEVSL